MIRLQQPSVAINDPRVVDADGKHRRRFHMWRTWDLPKPLPTRQRVIGYISELAGQTKRKNLVINCHGGTGYLYLGEGFGPDDVWMFGTIQGQFETIWLDACLVAGSQPGWDGNRFCSNMAIAAQCQVVAPVELQVFRTMTYQYGYIDNFEGLTVMFDKQGISKVFSVGAPAWMDIHGVWQGND